MSLAPEEPNIYGHGYNPMTQLQRSEMFPR